MWCSMASHSALSSSVTNTGSLKDVGRGDCFAACSAYREKAPCTVSMNKMRVDPHRAALHQKTPVCIHHSGGASTSACEWLPLRCEYFVHTWSFSLWNQKCPSVETLSPSEYEAVQRLSIQSASLWWKGHWTTIFGLAY